MRVKKATGDDDRTVDVLVVLGEEGLRVMTERINNIQVTGEGPRDFTEVTMNALQKMPKATECSGHRTFNLSAHTAKTVARIFR